MSNNFQPAEPRPKSEIPWGKLMFWVAVIIIISISGAQVARSMLGGVDPITPQAQKVYDAQLYALCEQEKFLADAKLHDYFHGFIDLSDEDMLRLKGKKESDCPF